MSDKDRTKYLAFLSELNPVGSLISVKERDGVKYFKWITINQLKAMLGI